MAEHPLTCAAAAFPLACAGCWHEPAREHLQHVGLRRDVPDEQRGNAVFEEVWWSATARP